jgi:hypothetical protein
VTAISIEPGWRALLAADRMGDCYYPLLKLSFGASGTATQVSSDNPLPVAIISGGSGGSSGGLTNTELRASAVPISGNVGVTGSVAVTGSFYQATQPVSIASMPTTPVTGTFWQATQPISGTVSVSGSVVVTGTFFQATQPVSIASAVAVTGTFWQATQPVSGTVTANAGSGTFAISAASLPLPSGAATETTLAAISTKTLAAGQATMANSSPVVLASNQSAIPVSGTFWQATQPISGTVTANVSGTVPVSGTFWQATQPVSGTFWQATQPVSGTVTANAGSGTFAVSGTFWQATQPVSIAATVAVSGPVTDAQLRASAVPVSLASMPSTPVTGTFWQATQPVSGTVTITPPTLTKGTQGATGISTQDLKDAGRTQFSAATVIGGVTCVTTEAMLSMVPVRAGVASGAATTIAVTSGKTLRLTAIVFSSRSSSAAVLSARCALRMNPNGAAIASSPILAIASTTQQAAALAEAGDTCVIALPDGIEISGTQQVGLSQVCSATTGVVYASLIGFEY